MPQVSHAKEKLLDSVLDLMYARSYRDVGVQEICEHAGVKKGSFYHFFPSKRDLTLAALDRQWEIARQELLERAFTQRLPPSVVRRIVPPRPTTVPVVASVKQTPERLLVVPLV